MNQLALEDPTPVVESRRLKVLVKHILCKFLFPLKSLRIPQYLLDFDGLDEFRRYNWPLAIHKFLHSQFQSLHRLSCSRENPASLGYLEECSSVLVVWFFEHSSMQALVNPLGRPLIARWASKGSFNYNFCRDLTVKLCVKDWIHTKFTECSMKDQELLGAKDVESSFEAVGKLLRKKIIKRTREDIKKENEEIQKLKEENKKEKEMVKKLMEGKKTERDLRKYIRSEIKALGKKVNKDIAERFDSIIALFQSFRTDIPVPSQATLSQPNTTVIPPSQYFKRCEITFDCLIAHITPTINAYAPRQPLSIICWQSAGVEMISSIYEDTGNAFLAAMTGWNIELVDSAPKQLNSHDCGVFVIKYMEAASSAIKINWEKCQDWQRMMPKFRAELADEMIRTFSDGSSKGLVQHEDSSSKGGS